MKVIEITAQNKSVGQTIVERFFEDGKRFMKVVPFKPQIYSQIKETFKNKNVHVELLNNGWIFIQKLGKDETLENAAKQVVGDIPVTPMDIAKMEMDMLTKAGYLVTIRELEE
jgi:hypothetical protein